MRIEGCSLRITLVALVAWKTLPNCAVKNISHPTTYKKIFPTYCLVAWCLFTEWECNKTPQNLQAFFSVLEAFLLGLGNFFLDLETVLDIEKNANASEEIILESDVLGSEEECFVVASYIGSVAG